MYQKFYRFQKLPFELTPDTRFLFLSRRHEEALQSLEYGITARKGFIVISGEIGTGKTTLCRALLRRLDKNVRTALILNPTFSPEELLQSIVEDLELKPETSGHKDIVSSLNQFLIDETSNGGNVAVIIDEAQSLSPRVLEEVRLLSNLETEREKLIQIVLVGQPELNDTLNLPELEQLRQRIAIRYHLTALSTGETVRYIDHRLKIASEGAVRVEFTPRAMEAIFEYSQGRPRLINIICDKALLAAFVLEIYEIDEKIVAKAIEQHRGPLSSSASSLAANQEAREEFSKITKEVEQGGVGEREKRGTKEDSDSHKTMTGLVVFLGLFLFLLLAFLVRMEITPEKEMTVLKRDQKAQALLKKLKIEKIKTSVAAGKKVIEIRNEAPWWKVTKPVATAWVAFAYWADRVMGDTRPILAYRNKAKWDFDQMAGEYGMRAVDVVLNADLITHLRAPFLIKVRYGAEGVYGFILFEKKVGDKIFVFDPMVGRRSLPAARFSGHLVTLVFWDTLTWKILTQGGREKELGRYIRRINEIGFPVPQSEVYSLKMRQAVVSFQKLCGLRSDGRLGKTTKALLLHWKDKVGN